ncbi:hypothetical protein BTN49_1239 [Candidatus Enterovibrio escicola]|uniref:Uncharacterized protein n=1 Tax=Candidatus Enterovibrio escicola TaxID=1927127 RepID=A0A2A5T513_9GAMM|nr:hypothetical protein BTN49_1239 [Candidatus Enterovibrio escacola]
MIPINALFTEQNGAFFSGAMPKCNHGKLSYISLFNIYGRLIRNMSKGVYATLLQNLGNTISL